MLLDLRTNRLTDPLGIPVHPPTLSWRLESGQQIAYQIQVATSPDLLAQNQPDLWDSQRTESSESVWVTYQGAPLQERQTAFWRVRAWTIDSESDWSEPATFETTLESWQAQWIGGTLAGGPRTAAPCPAFKKEFQTQKPIARARLYATALGIYQATLNGQKVGDHELAPGWTEYKKRVRFQTFDITDHLKDANHLEFTLADGWYSGHIAWRGRELYGDRPKLLAQLEIEYADGQTEIISTNESWLHAYGPNLECDILMGQAEDARQTYDHWQPVLTFEETVQLVPSQEPPVRITQEITPIEIKEIPQWPASRWLFDLGQNMVGRIRLKLTGQPGQTITLRYVEVLDKNGKIYTENLRSAKQTDYYTCKGGEEVWEPIFTFHGFRYVEIGGLTTPPTEETLTGLVLHSDIAKTGEFECSDPLINQLQENIDWGQRGNFVDVPTDCPQRDERLGWTGDAQVFVRTAAYNRDVNLFFRKYVQDMEEAQFESGAIPCVAPSNNIIDHEGGPAWADAFLICPWEIYQTYGDQEILSRHYPAFQRYFQFLENTCRDNRRCYPDYEGFKGFGDWLSHEANTPIEIIGTAFFAHAADLMSRIAGVLGHAADQANYQTRYQEIRQTFQDHFITPDGLVASGTQTAYVLALHFGLVRDGQAPIAVQELVLDIERRGDRLSTGFVGTPYLCHVLTAGGRTDVAYRLLNQKRWPSWLYPVTKGATTIWERWDGWTEENGFQDPGMNSFNHYAYGAIGDWMYRTILGIDLIESGYKKFRLAPQPGGGLTQAQGSLETPYGRIESAWKREGETTHYTFTIPPNTTAEITLPSHPPEQKPTGTWTYRI